MTQNSFLSRCGLAVWLLSILGCSSDNGSHNVAHEKPAKVEKLPVETDLATVTLSEDANRRLGIETRAVEVRNVAPKRTFGGEAIVPHGRSIMISAPVAGIVTRADGPIPLPGTRVTRGSSLLTLVPLLSPERDVPTPAEQVQLVGARANLVAAQTVAQGDVERSHAEVEGARIALERTQKLFQDRAGPRRDVDDAEAQFNIAQSVLEAALERERQLADLLELLQQPSGSSTDASGLPLATPIDGILNRLNVSVGQTVAIGTPLFEVVNLERLWVRVPIYVDLLASIQTDQPVHLELLSGESFSEEASPSSLSKKRIVAQPIAAPPTADARSSSADLYYEIDNRELGFRPGQRIGVELPLVGESQALVVPAAAILLDIYGGSWVYIVTGERQYTRRRVTVRWTAGDDAILASGPAAGSSVVVAGAAELFGTEFGSGK